MRNYLIQWRISLSSIYKSASVVALSTLVSRMLGFVREILFASYFGATAFTDIFFVAFRIPNLLRRLVAEGALTISFIPVYTEYYVNTTREEADILASRTLSLLIVVVSILTVAGIAFSPQLISLFGWGITDSIVIGTGTVLNRIMFPYLAMISFVAFSMGYLNSHDHYFAPAIAPVLLNIGFITGIAFLSLFFNQPLYGVAAGVLLGGFLQVLLQLPYLKLKGFRFSFKIDTRHPGIKKIFKMIVPALFGIAVYQINILMSTILASLLEKGSISYLYYTDRITEMVLGVFIVSIGNVILPGMSRVSAKDNLDALREMYTKALRASFFLALPAAGALIVIGIPVISVLFMRGEFSSLDVQMTYRSLVFSSIGIAPVAVLRITAPTYYALQDTRTPVIAASLAFVINISLGYILMSTSLRHAGLALANAIGVIVQSSFLLVLLQRKIGDLPVVKLAIHIGKILLSVLIMIVIIGWMSGFCDWYNDTLPVRAGWMLLIVVSGSFLFFLSARIFRIDESVLLWKKLMNLRIKKE